MRPSHAISNVVVNKVFTDREDARAIFNQAVDTAQPSDGYRVLAWHGVGGQGKSALCCEFQRMLERRRDIRAAMPGQLRTGWAVLDFDSPRHRNLEQAMLALRLQLAQGTGLSFPAFDTAFARYFALDNPGADMRQRHPELFHGGENEVLDDLIDWSETGIGAVVAEAASFAVPGVNLLYKYGARLSVRLREWWQRRGSRVLEGLDNLSADKLLNKLPTYLGADLCEALQGEHPPRLVMLIDTFEALWRDRGIKEGAAALRVDHWVRLLVQESPGVLFVILGRDRLHWDKIDPEWNQALDQKPLGTLSNKDADWFLRQVPIENIGVRGQIVKGAKGLPFYLDLQVDLFVAMLEKGATPQPSDFATTPSKILARFLDHLGEQEEQALRLASYPRFLDEPLLNNLANKFMGGAALVDWPRLTARSFMTKGELGIVTMHALMREELQRR
jgi:hypothetical protein